VTIYGAIIWYHLMAPFYDMCVPGFRLVYTFSKQVRCVDRVVYISRCCLQHVITGGLLIAGAYHHCDDISIPTVAVGDELQFTHELNRPQCRLTDDYWDDIESKLLCEANNLNFAFTVIISAIMAFSYSAFCNMSTSWNTRITSVKKFEQIVGLGRTDRRTDEVQCFMWPL